MTDAAEIAEWLTRFEKKFGINETRESLRKLSDARELFFSELDYNISRKQFEALKGESEIRELMSLEQFGIKREQGRLYRDKEHRDLVHQINYRDSKTGRFLKRENVSSLLATYDEQRQEILVKQISQLRQRQSYRKRGYEDRKI